MFDPFGDFPTAGYLRNSDAEKDLEIIKVAEHQLFRAQLPAALDFLKACGRIRYRDFLAVHAILFSGLYPWAGKDRAEVLPDRAVTKGGVHFCHPQDCERAIEEGLTQAQNKQQISGRPGFVMGLFAYGHPFLDGNGRTMLLVHSELCFRAGMSVDWTTTAKTPYLQALTQEIEDPRASHLDTYLRPFIGPQISRETWLQAAGALPGLDGIDAQANMSARYANPEVMASYQEFERRRNYKLD